MDERRSIQNVLLRIGICAGGLCLAASASGYNTSDIIATYAGNGTQGFAGDGSPAASAMLNQPTLMALDSAGNLYISDSGNNTIRKVSTAGIITTVAGTGSAGYNGDGIAATSAELSSPRGIAFDAAGNLYIADAGNERIRMISFASGIISTAAGNGTQGCNNDVASKATFNGPLGLAFDSGGALYISDAGNGIVRKLSNGYVSSFAGTCVQTAFQFPWGLATDGSGNVYVADDFAKRVFKVDSNGSQTLVAGNGAGGNTGDGGLATGAGVTLTDPRSVALDSAGNILISSGNVVRVVTPDGIIHTLAGNGSGGNSGDGGFATAAEMNAVAGLTVNAAGQPLIADSGSNVVRIVGPAATVLASVAGDGIAADGDAIASADGRINCPGACSASYVSGMPVILDATPLSADPLYQWLGATCRATSACTVVAQADRPMSLTARFTPWYIDTLLGGTVGPALQGPFALTLDASGNLYFTETIDCVVKKRTTTGALTVVAGNGSCGNIGDGMLATQAELNDPQGVAVDAAGNVYIQDVGNGVIRKVTTDGVLHDFASGVFTGSDSPALTINAGGDLFMLGSSTTIVRLTSDGTPHPYATISSDYANALQGLSNDTSAGLAVYGNVGDSAYPTLIYLSPQGTAYSSSYYPLSNYHVPTGIAYDQRGDLFVEIIGCQVIAGAIVSQAHVQYAVTGPSCGYSGDGGPAASASLNGAVGLALANNGYLYVADQGNNAIRVLYPDAIFTGAMDQ